MSNPLHLCMGCMNLLPEGRSVCGICGYPVDGENPPLYLPIGTILSERYLVGRVLETGGDAAQYIGYDQVLKSPILIREFLPDTLCERGGHLDLSVLGGCEKTYAEYLEKFRSHARALARMRDLPSMIPLYDIFDQHNTAYAISEYCEGISLETRLTQMGGRSRWSDLRPSFMTLMSSLVSLHAAGILHLGICPENILIGTDGKFHLRGFAIAAARTVNTDLKPGLLPGYSAPEQYAFESEPTAASDVYALAATIFRAITGTPPPEAASRARGSGELFVPTEVAADLPDHVAVSLLGALQVGQDKRTPTMAAFRDQLSAAPAVTTMRENDTPAAAVTEEVPLTSKPEKPKDNRTKYALLIVLAVFVVLLLVAGGVILMLFPEIFGGASSSSLPDSSQSLSVPPAGKPSGQTSPANKYAVPSLKNKNFYTERSKEYRGGLKLQLEYMAYSNKPKGTILSQNPPEETSVSENAIIKVTISAGPEQMDLPSVAGWPEEYAIKYLEALGYKVTPVKITVSDFERGKVQETDPAPGTKGVYGDTIILKVSDVAPTAPPTAPPVVNGWG